MYLNFWSYPFHIKKVNYYVGGKQLKVHNTGFTEVEMETIYVNVGFNDKNNKVDFGYMNQEQRISVSFVAYKGELYIIKTESSADGNFKSLHALIDESILKNTND